MTDVASRRTTASRTAQTSPTRYTEVENGTRQKKPVQAESKERFAFHIDDVVTCGGSSPTASRLRDRIHSDGETPKPHLQIEELSPSLREEDPQGPSGNCLVGEHWKQKQGRRWKLVRLVVLPGDVSFKAAPRRPLGAPERFERPKMQKHAGL